VLLVEGQRSQRVLLEGPERGAVLKLGRVIATAVPLALLDALR
jgi:hypothetical protein